MRMFQAHHQNRVTCVRFSPDAGTLSVVTRGSGIVTHLCVLNSERQLWIASQYHTASQIEYSADGSFIAVCDFWTAWPFRRSRMANNQHQFDSLGEVRVQFNTEHSRDSWLDVAFTPSPNPLRTWLGIAGTELHLWRPRDQQRIVAPEEGDYRGVSFGPDGATVTSIEYHAHALCVWNVKPFHVLFRTDLRGIDTFDNGAVAMLPDGGRVIYAAGDHLRCVPLTGTGGWETVTKKPPLEIALHPSGRMLLVADGSKKVTVYDTDNGRPATQYDWGIGKVGCVTYSPDGTLAAAGGEKGQVVVWDAE